LLVRLEEQRQRAEGGLGESAARLEGESAARLEQRMTAALDQQVASVADRLKGSSAEVEGLLARLEEQRQRAEGGLKESASRLVVRHKVCKGTRKERRLKAPGVI